MYCIKCRNWDTKVIDTRVVEDGRSIRRRRECERCGSRFTTFEKLEVVNFMVSKSDGNKEVYNREKVEKSILKSLNKRNISAEGVDNILLRLESKWSKNKSWVWSKTIWKDILGELKKLDEVAYIRYASVHQNFENKDDFISFISEN